MDVPVLVPENVELDLCDDSWLNSFFFLILRLEKVLSKLNN